MKVEIPKDWKVIKRGPLKQGDKILYLFSGESEELTERDLRVSEFRDYTDYIIRKINRKKP